MFKILGVDFVMVSRGLFHVSVLDNDEWLCVSNVVVLG